MEVKGEGAKQKSNFEHKARVSQSLFGRSQRTFDSRKEEQSYLTFFTILYRNRNRNRNRMIDFHYFTK